MRSVSIGPLNPQEIWLLEKYTSIDYFSPIVVDWRKAVDAAEQALELFMMHLPPDYRARPLNLQHDLVWGERILPIFRSSLTRLEDGLQMLKDGDSRGLLATAGPVNDWRNFNRDYYQAELFSEPIVVDRLPDALNQFETGASKAQFHASNIYISTVLGWSWTELTSAYDASVRGSLSPPNTWPDYHADLGVSMVTDEVVPTTGIYIPADQTQAPPMFMFAGDKAKKCAIGYKRGQAERRAACRWYLIRRGIDPQAQQPTSEALASQRLEAYAGTPCPRSGYWRTVARLGERRYVDQGKPMPEIQSRTHGVIIWYFDDDQRDTP